MKIFAVLISLCLSALVALAYAPVPVQKSVAEKELAAALEQAHSDSAKLKLAVDALAAHPEDVPMGAIALDVIMKLKTEPLAFMKARAEKNESVAAHYLAAVYDKREEKLRAAEWILKKDPNSFWGHKLAADAEWDKEKPDYAVLRNEFQKAIEADPSRPEGYLNMGWVYEEQEQWPEAKAAFEAARVADPESRLARSELLTSYAALKDSKAYFGLFSGIYPDKPLEMNLPRASGSGGVTAANLMGKTTVLEYWAFT